ncbi:hypothetical protein NP493_364g03037 [Ridgeia piscesae]|uniref:Uncharacterized protein n=1 Tax=Ridgeia piscesae TaxID=27915 RepID=A0AAD9NTG3_RIDPI|nr:hypothetical protein NP493_364g03037 [Ridgeia piscesae]
MNQARIRGAARVSSAGVKSPVARVRPQSNFGGALGCKVERDTLAESCPDLCGGKSLERDHATEQKCLEKIDSAISLSADNNDNDVHSPNGCEAGVVGDKTCGDEANHSQHTPGHKGCSLCRYSC